MHPVIQEASFTSGLGYERSWCLNIWGVGYVRNNGKVLGCYKPKNHRKVVLGQLLRGALSRVPKSLRCNYAPFYIDMSNFFGKQEVI